MTTLSQAGAYLSNHPREAMRDALGLVLICAAVFAGFMLPAFL